MTEDLTTTFRTPISGANINFDLAGHKVTTAIQDNLIRIEGGTLNIADSSTEKTGTLTCSGDQSRYGRIIKVGGDTSVESSCVNLYGGKLGVAAGTTGTDGVVVKVLNGTFNMYGGEITPGTCSTVGGSNCITVGNGTYKSILNIQGGNLKGEVALNSASAQLTIGGDAKVGVKEVYGIGELSLVARMCVCGAVGTHNQIGGCSVPEGKWDAWNVAICKRDLSSTNVYPFHFQKAGNYYLTEDLTTTYSARIAKVDINLDLAGHKVTTAINDNLIRMDGGTLNITDSSAEKTGALICSGEQSVYGRVINVWGSTSNTSCVNLYAGKLAAVAGATGTDGVIVKILNGTFNMFGGEITPGTCSAEGGSNAVTVGDGTKNSVLNVKGGTINGCENAKCGL